jgi:hypothetical protein
MSRRAKHLVFHMMQGPLLDVHTILEVSILVHDTITSRNVLRVYIAGSVLQGAPMLILAFKINCTPSSKILYIYASTDQSRLRC